MGKINLLTPNVFNMIAAGEVVERPSSVVKELVENAIDAGATQIDIYVEQGGIRKIQVSDNGIGIASEDMHTAFLPHATSKIANISDLDSISTLGFRGEALASIASVSEATMISAHNGKTASKIELIAGDVRLECEASREKGSIITIENLFFNTPARLKFLKKPSSELHYIQDTVRTLVLSNPQLSITLCNEEGALITHEGGDLIDAIYSVYDNYTATNLLKVDYVSANDITVKGYTSRVDFTKPNRTYQTIIINGRAVKDDTITVAAEKAYANYLMKRNYPVFVLDILMPFNEVDVNVHPSKTEVRFQNKNAVFSAVYHALNGVIATQSSASTLGFDATSDIANVTTLTDNFAKPIFTQTKIDTSVLYSLSKTAPRGFSGSFNPDSDMSLHVSTPYKDSKNVLYDAPISTHEVFAQSSSIKVVSSGEDNNSNNALDTNCDNQIKVFDGKIVGQIFDTYIIVERDSCVYIIDQHAAHERILYETILAQMNADFSQPLLIPYKLTLNGEEAEYLEHLLSDLEKIGFDIQLNSNVFLIKAVPQPVVNMDFRKLFSEIFADLSNRDGITLLQIVKDKLCQQACKAAIKGGESLNRAQLERVIKTYVDDNGNLPAQCPHGRPAVISVTKSDIEKIFKRIV